MRIAPAVMPAVALATPVLAAPPDWTGVDQALGRPGVSMPGDVRCGEADARHPCGA